MDAVYSKRWGTVKKTFYQSWLTLGGAEQFLLVGGEVSGKATMQNLIYAMKETTGGIVMSSITIR
ncbi:hypothetical protein [Methylobacter sp.]|uniref:hypothetical protein n=1 Tax=Methylobacter sp. TaxID=2051955 RepID=UPI002FDE2583